MGSGFCPCRGVRGGGYNRAATELSLGHITTKIGAYSGVFGFFRKNVTHICVFPG